MPSFQILYLRENVLAYSEDVDVRDLLEAIDLATAKAPDLTAEIRSNGTRVGMIGPSLDDNALRSAELSTPGQTDQDQEFEVRLQLAR